MFERRDPQLEAALVAGSTAMVVPAAGALAALYTALTAGHLVMLAPGLREILATLAMTTAAASAVTAARWRKVPEQPGADRVIAALALLVWTNTVTHLALVPELEHTTNFSALVLGLGLLNTRRAWFYPLFLLAVGSWVALVAVHDLTGATHWAWNLLFASIIAVVAHEQRRRGVKRTLDRERLLRHHAEVLQELMQAPELAAGTAQPFLDRILEAATEHLHAGRAGIWLYDGERQAIDAARLLDHERPDKRDFARHLGREAAPAYFEALDRVRTIAARDVRRDPVTRELVDAYLAPLGIAALLDSPIRIGATPSGVLCIEHRASPRHWSLEEQSFAASLANLAGVALQAEARADLERRARTAERLEAMGLLAGGVAHDFNNLLTTIIGNAELALLGDPPPPLRRHLDDVIGASQRAADLARQMLAYAGRAPVTTRSVDLNRVATDVVEGWSGGRDPGSGPTVRLALSNLRPRAGADSVQVSQLLLNLLVNAAEAGARTIDVRSGRERYDADALAACTGHEEPLEPGAYAWIEAEDDGSGMSADTLAHVLDPFFTTKQFGHGLGLAAAVGIMRVHRGGIEIDSREGRGTRVRFLFRPHAAEPEAPVSAPPPTGSPGCGRVLVLEDEPQILELVQRFLGDAGLQVEPRANLAEFDAGLAGVPLASLKAAIVDLTLPDGDGMDAVARLRAERPDLPVLLVSGFDAANSLERIDDGARTDFLAKPFRREQFLDALDRLTAQAS